MKYHVTWFRYFHQKYHKRIIHRTQSQQLVLINDNGLWPLLCEAGLSLRWYPKGTYRIEIEENVRR